MLQANIPPPDEPVSLEILEIPEVALAECARRSIPGAIIYFLVLVVVWFSTDYGAAFPGVVHTCTALLFFFCTVRVLAARRLLLAPPAARLAAVFTVSALASCAVWGFFSGFTAFHYLTNPKGLLVLASSAALISGATASLSPRRLLAAFCVYLIAVPTILGAVLRPEPEARAFAILSAVYTLFLTGQIHHNWRAFWAARRATDIELARLEAVRFASAKSLLLATMSHEVRTPMNGLVGMIDLILREDLPATAREYANYARSSALNLLGVLNNILAYSRNEKAGIVLNPARFDLRPWLHHLTFPFVAEAQKKGVPLTIAVELPDPACYHADSVRLSEVITNLLSNAVKFTRSGHIGLAVTPSDIAGHVLFTVTDTGPGMSSAVRAQLFEPFGHSAAGHQGAGLGLSITRQIVDAMGGRITVSSVPGAGSQFAVSVPLAPAHRALSGLAALIVEDDPVSALIARRLLENLGIRADVAATGADALVRAESRYDLFLLDVQLPDANGLELAARFRAMPHLSGATLVVTSASGRGELPHPALHPNIDAFLSKPYTASQLAGVLGSIASR